MNSENDGGNGPGGVLSENTRASTTGKEGSNRNYRYWLHKLKKLLFAESDKSKYISYEITDEEIEEFRKRIGDLDAFDRIGYSRPLGGYFYQFFYALIGAVIIASTYGLVLSVLYPFPTSKAYVDVSMVLFTFIQFVFNVPTGFAIERFIAEWRIKKPDRMLEYIRFYIWYQMTTGLVLLASLSIYILYALEQGNLTHLKWIMLVMLTREYPAMLDIFLQSIKGLQQFDKEAKINFIKELVSKSFEVGFVLLGRWWGAHNPAIGELMGIAIGYAVGTYVDDFVNAIIAATYFNKVLKHMGYRFVDAVKPSFSWETAKTSLWYGFQASWPGFFSSFTNMFVFFSWYNVVPAYATLVSLNKTADELANITKRSEGINLKGAISESYNNGRHKLTQFYIAQIWKWYGFFTIGIGVIVFTFFPTLLGIIFSQGELRTYMLAVPFLLPNVIHTVLTEAQASTAENIILGANRPGVNSIINILHNMATIFTTYLWIYVFKIPQTYGIPALIWLIPMGNFAADFGLLMLAKWIYIHKKIVPVKIPVWQAFIAPIFPGLISYGVGTLYLNTVHIWIMEALGSLIAGVIAIVFAFVVCFLMLFITLYSWFGGWDDYGLKVFYDAVEMSGPSKIFFKPIAVMSGWLIKKSPFHNKHPIPWEEADREAIELMIIREKNDMLKKLGSSPA